MNYATLRVCTRCVMDQTAADIYFDVQGICNYCKNFHASMMKQNTANRNNELELSMLVSKIKQKKGKSDYDCIVGVSGGIDSSYLLTQVINLGLRPLAVHMDNGWNSEIAQNNIAKIITKLNVDYVSHVIYWPEYRSLMESFFKADVVDIELLYDNAMLAVNYRLARKHKIKFIIGGTNSATEGFRMPSNWSWLKYDKKNIVSIHKLNENHVKISTFPMISIIEYLWSRFILKITWVSMLDLMDYRKESAILFLKENYGFKPYPYKHYESVFTRFYQGYILPTKFGIDKRRVHLSNLILTGQITREDAVHHLNLSPYPSEKELKNDIRFFLKKMNWDRSALEQYLIQPRVSHEAYKSNAKYWRAIAMMKRLLKGIINR